MSKLKPDPAVPAPSLDELMQPWKKRRDLGGSSNGYVNCQALNDVLSTRWRAAGRGRAEQGGPRVRGGLPPGRDRAARRGRGHAGGAAGGDARCRHGVLPPGPPARPECPRLPAVPEPRQQAGALVRGAERGLGPAPRQGPAGGAGRARHRAGGRAGDRRCRDARGGGWGEERGTMPCTSSSLPMHQSPRCGARTRSGSPCRSPAVKGKRRCRMHGAFCGAPKGNRTRSSTGGGAVSCWSCGGRCASWCARTRRRSNWRRRAAAAAPRQPSSHWPRITARWQDTVTASST